MPDTLIGDVNRLSKQDLHSSPWAALLMAQLLERPRTTAGARGVLESMTAVSGTPQ